MRSRFRLSHATVVAYAALFVALGGTATAVTYVVSSNSQIGPGTVSGHKPPTGKHSNIIANSINSKDIAPAAVGGGRLAPNSVDGSKVLDGSLGGIDVQDQSLDGADIRANSLAEVPMAQIGGFGRSAGGGSCNPGGLSYLDCVITTLNLPRAANVLLIGQATAGLDGASSSANGFCKLVTNTGDVPLTRRVIETDGAPASGSMVAITGQLGIGLHDFGVDCNQNSGGVDYFDVQLAAVAISPD